MAVTSEAAAAEAPAPHGARPLENGDRLTRPEFERRYHAMPELKKAELIEGKVYMPSPVNHVRHGNPHFNVIGWMGTYTALTPGVQGGDNSPLRLDLDNEPQPDAFLMVSPSYGGQAPIDDEGYVAGAPELIVEVAASSVSYDLHDKLTVYRRSGVREYITWRMLDETVEWRVLREGRYELLPPVDGIYKSEAFPGLWLDPAALLRGDLAKLFQVLQHGLASPEHSAFVERLREKAESTG